MLQTVALDGRFDLEIGAAIGNRPDRSLRFARPLRQARPQAERKPHAAALRQIDDTERDVAPREPLSGKTWVRFGHRSLQSDAGGCGRDFIACCG